jgi:hypothetical protein
MFRAQGELVDWAEDVRARGEINIHRIHSMRNRVIHDAVREARGQQQLADITLNSLDALYQVLAAGWMSGGHDPWRALDDIQRRQDQRWKAWRGASGTKLPLDPKAIIEK